jgi:hypothetical protein
MESEHINSKTIIPASMVYRLLREEGEADRECIFPSALLCPEICYRACFLAA